MTRITYSHEQHTLILQLLSALRLMVQAWDAQDLARLNFLRYCVVDEVLKAGNEYDRSDYRVWLKKQRGEE